MAERTTPITDEEIEARLAALSDDDVRQASTNDYEFGTLAFHGGWRTRQRLAEEVMRLRAAIRQHRDERGDDRCHADDGRLYAVLPEGDTRPAIETAVTLENCARYIECRQTGREYVSPQRRIEELEAESSAERDALRKLVEDMRAYVLHHGILIGECVAWDQLKKRTGVGQS